MAQQQSIVFVVDDDLSVRESLALLLRVEGLDVETFASARELLARPPPDGPARPGGCALRPLGDRFGRQTRGRDHRSNPSLPHAIADRARAV